jgi:hypothetical protein
MLKGSERVLCLQKFTLLEGQDFFSNQTNFPMDMLQLSLTFLILASTTASQPIAPFQIEGTAIVVVEDLGGTLGSNKFLIIENDAGHVIVDENESIEHIKTGDYVKLNIRGRGHSNSHYETLGNHTRGIHHHVHEVVDVQPQAGTTKAANKVTSSGTPSILIAIVTYADRGPTCSTSCVTSLMWTATNNVNGMYADSSYSQLTIPQNTGLPYLQIPLHVKVR